jgi:hypothetical protein
VCWDFALPGPPSSSIICRGLGFCKNLQVYPKTQEWLRNVIIIRSKWTRTHQIDQFYSLSANCPVVQLPTPHLRVEDGRRMPSPHEVVEHFIETARAAIRAPAIVGAVFCFPKAERRVNRIFETYKEELAVRLCDPSILWIEYDSGAVRRCFLLHQGLGFWPTLRVLRQNAVSDRCKDWTGAERRIKRGSFRDRVPSNSNGQSNRCTDSPDFVGRMTGRVSHAMDN